MRNDIGIPKSCSTEQPFHGFQGMIVGTVFRFSFPEKTRAVCLSSTDYIGTDESYSDREISRLSKCYGDQRTKRWKIGNFLYLLFRLTKNTYTYKLLL